MSFPYDKRPSLCGYCLAPGRGFYLEYDRRIYAGCKMDHLEKIRERLLQQKSLGIKATSNPQATKYAMGEIKKLSLEISDKHKTFAMHEWSQEDRDRFFNLFASHYLSFESEVADKGMPPMGK